MVKYGNLYPQVLYSLIPPSTIILYNLMWPVTCEHATVEMSVVTLTPEIGGQRTHRWWALKANVRTALAHARHSRCLAAALLGSWSAAALQQSSPFAPVCCGWWWINVLSNDLGRCAAWFNSSGGGVSVAQWCCVPPLVRARRQRFLPSETWRTQGYAFDSPLDLARACFSDAAEL